MALRASAGKFASVAETEDGEERQKDDRDGKEKPPPLNSSFCFPKYLKKSEDNKAKNDKESYYKRNYKDYFDFVEGSLRAKKGELSESEQGILDWLQKNK
ncbi:unnamed protein product [Thlaspi arvense]|uniref:Uncharacterized protein n=1 Tax=Thlaspi arvense TaxID=13288 RepID=A0AAU9RI05_THLAR|nr:unnamed protein product [Thlaspi arvense]